MSVEKEDFLEFAKNLSEDSEINLRNAVSRTYYAAYHACSEIYRPNGVQNGGVHKHLVDSLKKSPDSHDRKIGFILDQLRLLRISADYFLAETLSIEDKKLAIKQTERLLLELN
jgi:uncharacterized protein (UPF0332 family)